MPIAWWHVEDVWDYIKKQNIKYPKVYEQELEQFTKLGTKEKVKGIEMDRNCIRVGCWCCPLTIKYTSGVMKQLRKYYYKQWNYLMKDMGLAKEIAKIKLNGQGSLFDGYFDEDKKEYWLENRPCFFDKI